MFYRCDDYGSQCSRQKQSPENRNGEKHIEEAPDKGNCVHDKFPSACSPAPEAASPGTACTTAADGRYSTAFHSGRRGLPSQNAS